MKRARHGRSWAFVPWRTLGYQIRIFRGPCSRAKEILILSMPRARHPVDDRTHVAQSIQVKPRTFRGTLNSYKGCLEKKSTCLTVPRSFAMRSP